MYWKKLSIFFYFFCACFATLLAQQKDCVFQNPLIIIHFGSGKVDDINMATLPNYSRDYGTCPTDGHYSFVSATSECFSGDWFTLSKDHTPGSKAGNMMLVNASPEGGVFFSRMIDGLKPGSTYELAAWLMNVCRINGGCSPLPPKIIMRLSTTSGKLIDEFQTGELVQTYEPKWSQYRGVFAMPAQERSLILTMSDITTGGCGNDFALDDITFRECNLPKPTIKQEHRSSRVQIHDKKNELLKKPLPKIESPTKLHKENTGSIGERLTKDSFLTAVLPKVQQSKILIPVPEILLARTNPLVRQITTEAGEIRVDLYDNGIVDGDTVTVYHNNQVIVSRAMLSEKPITIRIKVDKDQPHHELIMVANNLGSIPPNTALMIVTTKERRYEVFISTNEQANAKVVIDLK